MRILLQRVLSAAVAVGGETVGSIGPGLLALVGCRTGDAEADADRLAARTAAMRVFEDADGRMNRSVADSGGAVLAVSQFTLYADTRKGNRPSFIAAGDPAAAEKLYDRYCEALRAAIGPDRVATGRFGADMRIEAVLDGPCTIGLESGAAPAGK
ncbi:MAG: D-tyrosyl-tRNA(Tyr) deacylase [Kiritimatiellae bacterium]|nr:D-tyrosyl-tRNA(Tyr) deacylase [Kiritimatiellia bacterium]